MNKVQHNTIATREECNKIRMENENISKCKIATWNRAIHKKSSKGKKGNMKKLLHEKVQHRNGAVWKKCNIEKEQHDG